MVKKRVIPIILVRNGRCVKGQQFRNHQDVGNPVTVARVYNDQEADELIFLAVDGKPLEKILEAVAREVFIPLSAGGGINSLEDARRLFESGADKIVLRGCLYGNPEEVTRITDTYGVQSVIHHLEYIHWFSPTSIPVGEIMLTNITREGMRTGLDLNAIRLAKKIMSCPIIASGGAKDLADIANALKWADAVAIGSLFHFTDQSPIKVRHHLKNAGIDVR